LQQVVVAALSLSLSLRSIRCEAGHMPGHHLLPFQPPFQPPFRRSRSAVFSESGTFWVNRFPVWNLFWTNVSGTYISGRLTPYLIAMVFFPSMEPDEADRLSIPLESSSLRLMRTNNYCIYQGRNSHATGMIYDTQRLTEYHEIKLMLTLKTAISPSRPR